MTKLLIPLILSALFAVGMGTGLLISNDLGTLLGYSDDAGDEQDSHEDVHDADYEEDLIALSLPAFRNLGLKLDETRLTDYVRKLRIPGEIVEQPGHSTHTIAAPVNGVVTSVLVEHGMAVRPGDALFELQVVDESLLNAELALLEVLSELEIVEAELTRLRPLTESGSLAGKKKLELEYQKRQLTARRDIREQELRVRGLSNDQVEKVTSSHQLIRKFTVELLTTDSEQAVSSGGDQYDYTIEQIQVHPGSMISRGDNLCLLAFHRSVQIRGEAFENEIDLVCQVGKTRGCITAEFGAGEKATHEELRIGYIDNHVAPEAQTYRFYTPLENEVVQDVRGEDGRLFRTWLYKVGQRVHLLIPVERFTGQFVLPVAAVVEDGPDAFVFRLIEEVPPHDEEASHGEDMPFIELEPVPVHVVHRDESVAVIAADDVLLPGSQIAMNGAYQLHLALENQQIGGGGHHHHDH